MTLCYLGLGSNENQPLEQLTQALKTLYQSKDIQVLSHSHFYQSKPCDHSNQAPFINAVVMIDTGLSAPALLKRCQELEQSHQRVRYYHWGPRTLDVDILLYGDAMMDSETLTIPHKELLNRDFVIIPLLEISPELTLPCGTQLKHITNKLKPFIEKKVDYVSISA